MLKLMSKLMSHASHSEILCFVFYLPCVYAYVASENQPITRVSFSS